MKLASYSSGSGQRAAVRLCALILDATQPSRTVQQIAVGKSIDLIND